MVEHEDLEVGCKCSRYRVLLLIDSFVFSEACILCGIYELQALQSPCYTSITTYAL